LRKEVFVSDEQQELTTPVPELAPSGAMISAQRPVSRRVSASAKELRKVLQDSVFPALVNIVRDNQMPAKERVKAAEVLVSAFTDLERLIANTESDRMALDVKLHGRALAAKNIQGSTIDGESGVDEQGAHEYAFLSDNIIDIV
jgi:hypothetical protein